MTPLRLGKTWGLRRMATPAGRFNMVALDQRLPIANVIAHQRGIAPADVAFADMLAVKRSLVATLGERASAMLLDPNYAIPGALACLPAHTGLVVALEDHRFVEEPGGRLSHSIPDWSVAKIKRLGADGVKLLVWYRPDAAADICQRQRDYIQEIGAQCRQHDIAFVLELLVYTLPKSGQDSVQIVAESPEKRADLVLASVREFVQPKYGVDLLKLESPLPSASLPEHGSPAAAQAQMQFDAMGTICRDAGIPWVMLSAGVTGAQFLRVMQYACAAGANGFLAGRAIWGEALAHYPDQIAFETQLRGQGMTTLTQLCDLTARAGSAWQPDYRALSTLAAEGDFCRQYR